MRETELPLRWSSLRRRLPSAFPQTTRKPAGHKNDPESVKRRMYGDSFRKEVFFGGFVCV
jgi:hypothetical protein